MKNRGQALVEFVIILPIFLMLIISSVDIFNIMTKKYELERDLDTVVNLYKTSNQDEINSFVNKEGIDINYTNDDKFITISLSKSVKIISPILIPIFKNPYNVTSEAVIYK